MLPVAILAGGLATRLRPLTETIPKSLVDINGEPFLWHQLRLLRSYGVDRVVLCVSHLGEKVRESVGDGGEFGLRIDYSFDGDVLLGTAGALNRALPMLGESFFVLYGDSYLPIDLRAVESAFRASEKAGLMTVYSNHGQWDSSNVEFAGGRILAYDKKQRTERMRYIDYGLGAFRMTAFDRVPDGTAWDLAALYQDLLGAGELAAFEAPQRFYEIGSFSGIEELSSYLRQGCQTA
ncbi:MAG TPA: nucleotidyltransferase family protein [Bryobacteraceae bacterium]|jgi:NDP-sugar pyrophosphorylase family protein|nr:nucleotidyltransferase family protein [Bryobacteraceae bacterium]